MEQVVEEVLEDVDGGEDGVFCEPDHQEVFLEGVDDEVAEVVLGDVDGDKNALLLEVGGLEGEGIGVVDGEGIGVKNGDADVNGATEPENGDENDENHNAEATPKISIIHNDDDEIIVINLETEVPTVEIAASSTTIHLPVLRSAKKRKNIDDIEATPVKKCHTLPTKTLDIRVESSAKITPLGREETGDSPSPGTSTVRPAPFESTQVIVHDVADDPTVIFLYFSRITSNTA